MAGEPAMTLAEAQAAVDEAARVEDAAVEDATARLDAQLAAIVAVLLVLAAGGLGRGDRRRVADRLRRVRPRVAVRLRVHVEQAAGDGPIPARARDAVDGVDRRVRVKAREVAREIMTAPAGTESQVRELADRVEAVGSVAEAAASEAIMTTVNARTVEETPGAGMEGMPAPGVEMVWVTEPDACLHCLGYAGSVSTGGVFRPRLSVADHPLPWATDGVVMPPLHSHCRCRLVPATRGLADALAQNAARDLAAGRVGFVSPRALARAARRLLQTRAPLRPIDRRRAAALSRSA